MHRELKKQQLRIVVAQVQVVIEVAEEAAVSLQWEVALQEEEVVNLEAEVEVNSREEEIEEEVVEVVGAFDTVSQKASKERLQMSWSQISAILTNFN